MLWIELNWMANCVMWLLRGIVEWFISQWTVEWHSLFSFIFRRLEISNEIKCEKIVNCKFSLEFSPSRCTFGSIRKWAKAERKPHPFSSSFLTFFSVHCNLNNLQSVCNRRKCIRILFTFHDSQYKLLKMQYRNTMGTIFRGEGGNVYRLHSLDHTHKFTQKQIQAFARKSKEHNKSKNCLWWIERAHKLIYGMKLWIVKQLLHQYCVCCIRNSIDHSLYATRAIFTFCSTSTNKKH